MSMAQKKVLVKGEVFSGVGEGASFVRLDWVMKQMAEKAGFKPYPGTLNLRVTESEYVEAVGRLKMLSGIVIQPVNSSFCTGKCFKALVNSNLTCCIVVPDKSRYGSDIVEVIAPINLRKTLGLSDGDTVTLQVFAE